VDVTLTPRRFGLRAVIEEARNRARRRRLALTAILVVGGAGIAVGVALTGGSATRVDAPPGFTVVKAKGQVAHAVIEYGSMARITSLSGRDRPAKLTEEVWYDARRGLWRDVVRVDGRVRNDRAGTCAVSRKEERPCGGAPPLRYLHAFDWPPSTAGLHVTGTGAFRGKPVVWLASNRVLSTPRNQVTQQIGLDPRTHRLVVARYFSHGHPVGGGLAISQQTSLPAAGFSFVVREHAAGGAPDSFGEPFTGRLLAYGLPAARRTLGRNLLWLGPRFHGYLLRSVQSGTYPFGTTKSGALRRAPFVRFYYGTPIGENYVFSVEEFGSIRPYFYKQGPRAGSIERDGTSIGRMTSDGLLLRVISGSLQFQLTRANGVAVARALRPLPPGLKTVPTLRQQ
jgi:hypothetical protein